MRSYLPLVVLSGLLLFAGVQAEDTVRIDYEETLHSLSWNQASTGAAKPGRAQSESMHFDAFGRRFDLLLEPNRTIIDAIQLAQVENAPGVYRGSIAGLPDSWVRLVVEKGRPQGMLSDGTTIWAMETSADSGQTRMFRLDDLHIAPGALGCSDVQHTGSDNLQNLLEASKPAIRIAQGPGASLQLDLAVMSDSVFTDTKGVNTATEVMTRMNNVDGIFSEQLGVQMSVARLDIFDNSNDPFTSTADARTLLDELTAYRSANAEQTANGLTHLFTGRNLDTTTVGIAYTGALCSSRFGAGLTQGTHSTTIDSVIAAHELGHNFGAPHDGTSGSACESEPDTFLMAPNVNGNDQFSACSITQMQDDVSRASCINPLPVSEIAVLATMANSSVLLGDSVTVSFDVNSVGSNDVDGVSFDVNIPAGISLSSITSTIGSCTNGAGNASCTIGMISAGSGATVSLDLSADTVGNSNILATVSATSDANSNNNQASQSLTVDPAVELLANTAASARVTSNQTATIQLSIDNEASIAATDVTVSLSVDPEISIDSGSWAAGSCSVSANRLDCDAASLAAESSNSLSVTISATDAGSYPYTIVASATEVDRDTSNNSASGTITVADPPAESSGGGSGFWLALLLLFAAKRRLTHRFE